MPDKNIQMTQRNTANTGWDNLNPITLAANVKTAGGSNVEAEMALKAPQSALNTTNSKLTDIRYAPNTGTANAIVVSKTGFTLANGNYVEWQQTSANTGTVTINVTSTGVKSLRNTDGTLLVSGDLEAGFYRAIYDSVQGFFVLAPRGGASKLNVYAQLAEPAKKEGIWIQTAVSKSKIINDLELWFADAWNDTAIKSYPDPPIADDDISICTDGTYFYVFEATKLYRFNPLNDTYTLLGTYGYDISRPRIFYHNRRIYILGYLNTTNYSCYFDFNTSTFTVIANSPNSNYELTVTFYNGYFYRAGGRTSATTTAVNTFHRYDPVNNTYTALATLPQAVTNGVMVGINNKLYLIGGSSNSGESGVKDSIQIYDIATNTWTNTNILADRKFYLGACSLIGNKVYILTPRCRIGASTTGVIKFFSVDLSDFSIIDYATPSASPWYGDTMPFINNKLYTIPGSSSPYSTIAYAFTSKAFSEGNVILYRTSETAGDYQTELVSPSNNALEGVNLRLTSFFNNVYMYINGKLEQNLPTYYGNGTQWIKFKG